MEAAENEKVEFVPRLIPASAKGLVEEWLHEVNICSLYLGFAQRIIIFSSRSEYDPKCISHPSNAQGVCEDIDRFNIGLALAVIYDD